MSGSIAGTVGAYWDGRAPLWKAFWLWGVVGSWVLAAIIGALFAAVGVSWPLYVLVGAVMAVYTVWILVAVWRCAANARDEQIAVIARVLTVAWALNVILVGGFLGLDLLGATSL